jgi:hypothetical protein
MSSIQDPAPMGGDGPNRGDDLGDSMSSASAERRGDEGSGELQDADAPLTASEDINPE